MKEPKNLLKENTHLKSRLAEAEELLTAIKSGAVDALVTNDEKIFILKGADHAYRVFVENMNEGAGTLTPKGIVMYCNNSLAKALGVPIERIIGGSIFDFVGTDDISRLKSILRKSKDQTTQDEIHLKKDNKKLFPVAVSCSPMKLEDEGICMVVTDLTERKNAELKITKQREEILHATRVGKLAEFTASLAHEISQPLTATLSYAQAVQRLFEGREPELQEILRHIIHDNQRAVAIVQQLRGILKKSEPKIKPLDINALVKATVDLVITDATLRKDVLKVELESNLPFVYGDQIQMQQVLMNLISNSFDALKSRRGARSVLIRTSRKDADTIVVEVMDSGCGISKENIPKLFSSFFTSKPDGLGMGLCISRSIVEAHGGRIEMKNNSDRGITFYFTIPVIQQK
ncbi:MAG: hypothetical protein A2Y03_10260 [Omnitrophica WOR_2 bacterium GWF2_38_59]|nr:MAG: hypothetical protein A2Y03_10260 [Omnitrophica WOR_2 bacterium GWF2_38_59]OGX50542.1 MAG: hypothetical protein A2243_06275 [Omnitrophica WOR_2 bacterium RIFOXYA2_FULL_38_17]OGX55207.1 MAG: hypothetical protein A2447_04510 [Omnitrophica WOR_2 bacterium RIFOXYC2_FULL_38_12]